jgi:hypothetical protein
MHFELWAGRNVAHNLGREREAKGTQTHGSKVCQSKRKLAE